METLPAVACRGELESLPSFRFVDLTIATLLSPSLTLSSTSLTSSTSSDDTVKHRMMVFFHGGLHIVNLAIGDAAKKLPKSWIKHMQKTISWFRRSAERTASLRAAGIAVEAEIEEMQTALNEIVDAKGMGFTNLSMYCKTRWSGMFSSAMSLIRCWPALLTLKSDLIAKGWGPSDGDDAEIAGFGVARPGALPRGAGANPDDDPIGSALSAADPNAALNCGDTTASAKKRSVLLSSTLGITDAMWGMSIAVAEVLRPMNILIKRMQTVKQPVQHRFSRWIKEALMLVEVHFAGTPGGGRLRSLLRTVGGNGRCARQRS